METINTTLLDYVRDLDVFDSRELWDVRDDMAEDVRADLDKLDEEVSSYAGDSMEDGVTFIRETYFQEYAQELAEELGMLSSEVSWPYTCIDWEWAAKELQSDYTSVKIDGIWYYYR